MRSGRFRALVVLWFITAGFFFLTGFEPSDVVYEDCGKIKAFDADCAGFRAAGAGKARNVILMIGDGMGIGQAYAGRVYVKGPERPLSFEELPHRGLITTCSISSITDSAAAATALATGRKTTNGAISVGPLPQYQRYETILELARAHKATGLVTTTGLWHATPAAFASHADRRSQSFDIARQMVEESGVDVMLGGGAKVFRGDNRNPDLVPRARELGYRVVTTGEELKSVDFSETSRLLGLFSDDHMTYEKERPEATSEPHLSEMVEAALRLLSRDPRGFFLMIEGGRIDHACHGADMGKLLGEMAEFDRAVSLVLDFAGSHPETLVLITADHDTGGVEVVPGDYAAGDRVQVKWTSRVLLFVNHSSQRVPVYGTGPNAGAIKPRMDNTEVFCIMRNALGLEER